MFPRDLRRMSHVLTLGYGIRPSSLFAHALSSSTSLSSGVIHILFDSTNVWHKDIQYHPEQSARIDACINALQQYKTESIDDFNSNQLNIVDVAPDITAGISTSKGNTNIIHQPFTEKELEYARSILVKTHSEEYVNNFEQRCRSSKQKRIDDGKDPLGFVGYIDEDTYLTTETYDVCLRATCAWIQSVDLVLQPESKIGDANNEKKKTTASFALTRPPGHHACRTLSNGFCIFNFAAAAAIHALQSKQASKISILDWDVHYGEQSGYLMIFV